jgi:hypothetical protein
MTNGVDGDAKVAEMWRDFFEKRYNVYDNVDSEDHFESLLTTTTAVGCAVEKGYYN